MRTKFLSIAVGLVAIGVVRVPIAHAESPGLTSYVWDLPALGFGDCMQRASSALLQLGVKDVRQVTPSTGLGFVGGEVNDYYLGVICVSFKGIVVTQATGANFDTAESYRRQIDSNMGNGSGR